MSGLKPFKQIPENIVEWTRWMMDQDIPDPVSDSQLSGSKTFQSQNIAQVTFDNDEDDADYHVLLDVAVNETFWVTLKKVTGFRIHSSNASSGAKVKWLLFR